MVEAEASAATSVAEAAAVAAATATVSTLGRDQPVPAATEATTPTRLTSIGGETKKQEFITKSAQSPPPNQRFAQFMRSV